MRTSIWQAAMGAIGGALLVGLGPELWKFAFEKKPPIEYKVLVYSSAADNPPLPRAAVELVEGGESVAHETSPEGVATFLLVSEQGGKAASLHVTKGGFQKLERPIRIPESSAPEHVYLEP